jgi:hypothetical protein
MLRKEEKIARNIENNAEKQPLVGSRGYTL